MSKQVTFCTIENCTERCAGRGMCRIHYKRWYRYGDPLILKKSYRQYAECSVDKCVDKPLAKGLCERHYALYKRHGVPERKRVFVGAYIKDGYRYVMIGKRHYVPEHRIVMEKFLGRKLESSENIHHVDRNTLNNSPSNLQLVTRSEHLKLHVESRPRGEHGRYIKA